MLKFILNTVLASGLLLMSSCVRDDVEVQGTETSAASGSFAITSAFTISDDMVDFSSEPPVVFTATFNEVVSYRIVIKGRRTGAIKTIHGVGSSINESWSGDAESIFFQDEICYVELWIDGKESPVVEDDLVITGVMNPPGNLISDFEPLGPNVLLGFWEADVNGNPTRILCERTAEVAVQGDYAFHLRGQNYFPSLPQRFLGLGFAKPIQGVNGLNLSGIKYNVGTLDADAVWFNVWVYGKGTDKSMLAIKFMQDDNLDGDHQGDSENGFECVIDDLSHTGWKLFSVKYTTLGVSGNLQFGGSGDRVHRPERIAQVEFALWSKVSNEPVEVIFDYPIFTINNPLNQQ